MSVKLAAALLFGFAGVLLAIPNTSAVESLPTPVGLRLQFVERSGLIAHADSQYGGQALESGDYFLEFVPIVEDTTIHLDFFLEIRDTHETVPNATVRAQVQLPDGSQQSLDMTYDAEGEHYIAVLDSSVTGEYRVAVLSQIEDARVNGRFRFTR